MFTVDQMLSRGFGLVVINDLLSVRLHDDILLLCIGACPGYTTEPTYYELSSRSVSGVMHEIFDFTSQFFTQYVRKLQNDILTF